MDTITYLCVSAALRYGNIRDLSMKLLYKCFVFHPYYSCYFISLFINSEIKFWITYLHLTPRFLIFFFLPVVMHWVYALSGLTLHIQSFALALSSPAGSFPWQSSWIILQLFIVILIATTKNFLIVQEWPGRGVGLLSCQHRHLCCLQSQTHLKFGINRL